MMHRTAALIFATMCLAATALATTPASADGHDELSAPSSPVELAETFEVSAPGCGGGIAGQIDHVPMAGDPGAFPYSESITNWTSAGSNVVATVTLPATAPTGRYRITADCLILGINPAEPPLAIPFQPVWIDVIKATSTLSASSINVDTGETFTITSTGCQGPPPDPTLPPIPDGGAPFVEYTIRFIGSPAAADAAGPVLDYSETFNGEYTTAGTVVDIVIPHGAPTVGVYQISARCLFFGIAGLTFGHDNFPTVDIEVSRSAVTCFGANITVWLADGQVATPGDDVILGSPELDRINGLAGNDRICGGAGSDRIKGGPGDDLLAGNKGRDRLAGGAGTDTCVGGKGKDKIIGCEQ